MVTAILKVSEFPAHMKSIRKKMFTSIKEVVKNVWKVDESPT